MKPWSGIGGKDRKFLISLYYENLNAPIDNKSGLFAGWTGAYAPPLKPSPWGLRCTRRHFWFVSAQKLSCAGWFDDLRVEPLPRTLGI